MRELFSEIIKCRKIVIDRFWDFCVIVFVFRRQLNPCLSRFNLIQFNIKSLPFRFLLSLLATVQLLNIIPEIL